MAIIISNIFCNDSNILQIKQAILYFILSTLVFSV